MKKRERVKVGELVKISDVGVNDSRQIGTVLKFDVYKTTSSGGDESIAEVMWNNGGIGWVLTSRLEMIL